MDIFINTTVGQAANKKRSNTFKEKLKNISKDELLKRMKNSFGSCDHVKRGKLISESKKGVKTNQQEIVGKHYDSMTDSEFNEMLKTKSQRVHKRIINLRLRFIDG